MSLGLADLLTHCVKWLAQLDRAKVARKKESKDALVAVIQAARATQVYLRELNDTQQRNYKTETSITKDWTELGQACQDLGLIALAKRCEVSARYWADPEQLGNEFIERADIKTDSIIQRAKQALAAIEK